MDVPQFVYLSIEGHFDCFKLLAIINKAALKIHVQGFVWISIFLSLGQTPRTVIARVSGKCMFSVLGDCPAIFQSGCANLHSY